MVHVYKVLVSIVRVHVYGTWLVVEEHDHGNKLANEYQKIIMYKKHKQNRSLLLARIHAPMD